MRRLIQPLCALLLGLLVATSALAADTNGDASSEKAKAAATKAAASKKAAPKTLTVKTESLKIEVAVKGIFEASEMTEVSLRPESWSAWTVLEAIAQGKQVKEGDKLVELDTKKIDIAIADMETARASSDLSRKLADKAFQLAKKSVPLQLDAAERANQLAAQNLENFIKTDRAEAIKDANYNVEQNENYFLYELEELRQLERMYKEDDVTEETEEIILLRLQHRIKNAKLRVAKSRMSRDRMIKYRIPREEASVKAAAEGAAIALESARATLPASLVQKRLALEKLDRAREKEVEKLSRVRRDRAAMTILSPAEGLVYYGQCLRGQWSTMTAVSRVLQPKGTLKPNMVVMTIVKPDSMFVRVTVAEKSLYQLEPGVKATVVPAAFPEQKLSAELAELSTIPISAGKFDGQVKLAENTEFGRVVPGMACSVTFTSYENPEAILVPKTAVQDEDGKFVYVQVDDKPQKREVKTGKFKGDKVEIVDGLSAGDVVLLEKPAE